MGANDDHTSSYEDSNVWCIPFSNHLCLHHTFGHNTTLDSQGGHVAPANGAAPNGWHRPAVTRVELPLSIDPSQISISGISSGADMTVQVQVAFSSLIMGSGVFAGQPWRCAIHRFGPSDTQYVISLSLKTCEPQQKQQHTLSLKEHYNMLLDTWWQFDLIHSSYRFIDC